MTLAVKDPMPLKLPEPELSVCVTASVNAVAVVLWMGEWKSGSQGILWFSWCDNASPILHQSNCQIRESLLHNRLTILSITDRNGQVFRLPKFFPVKVLHEFLWHSIHVDDRWTTCDVLDFGTTSWAMTMQRGRWSSVGRGIMSSSWMWVRWSRSHGHTGVQTKKLQLFWVNMALNKKNWSMRKMRT